MTTEGFVHNGRRVFALRYTLECPPPAVMELIVPLNPDGTAACNARPADKAKRMVNVKAGDRIFHNGHVCTHAHYTTAQVIDMLRQLAVEKLPDPMLISMARQYSRRIFPLFCDCALDQPFVAKHRQELLAGVCGEVPAIGFGTGLNLPHYPEHVRRITTVDPNPGMQRRAPKRIDQTGIEVGLPAAVQCNKGGTAMANLKKRVPENVLGDFFVDSTCIDCDACRQIAPAVFGEASSTSFVHSQPISSGDRRQALRALLACPTGSIGCLGDDDPKTVMKDFPLVIEEPVYYCGYNSPKSYGGNSYLIRHPDGNWLIDSPKFIRPLVNRLETLGGIANIFLTHRDDVADAQRFAEHFGSRRIIHRDELSSQPGSEFILEGNEPIELAPGFLAIPTPGHTKGHCVLLFDERFLFTGDHLDWDRDSKQLAASEEYCWYSWPKQVESMERLVKNSFEWVLPGHGQRVRLPAAEMLWAGYRLLSRLTLAAG